MKIRTSLTTAFIFVIFFWISCTKKNIVSPVPVSAVTIVDAIDYNGSLIPDFSSDSIEWFSMAQTIGYGNAFEYSVPSGSVPLMVFPSTDTLNNIFSGKFDFKPGAIYSIFFSGTSLSNNHNDFDTLLVQDIIPYYPLGDSSTGVRFVNLCVGSNPVNVNIQGSQNKFEIRNLPYKGVSQFITYPASGNVSDYLFEFRDAQSGSLIASYDYNSLACFHSVTLVLCGAAGDLSNDAPMVFQVDNF